MKFWQCLSLTFRAEPRHVQPAEPTVKEQQQWHRSMKRTPE